MQLSLLGSGARDDFLFISPLCAADPFVKDSDINRRHAAGSRGVGEKRRSRELETERERERERGRVREGVRVNEAER